MLTPRATRNPRLATLAGMAVLVIPFMFNSEANGAEPEAVISNSMQTLMTAFNQRDFAVLEPLISRNYSTPGFSQYGKETEKQISKKALKLVICSDSRKFNNYKINSITNEGANLRAFCSFTVDRSVKPLNADFLLTKRGEILEINGFFEAEMSRNTGLNNTALSKNIFIPDYMEAPFELAQGRILVEAEVNGKTGKYLVDSGTDGLSLNSLCIQQCGLKNDMDDKENGKAELFVAGGVGGIAEYYKVRVAKFKWQKFEMLDFEALTEAPNEKAQKHVMGRIGYAELSCFETVFDYKNKILFCFKLDDKGDRITRSLTEKPDCELCFSMQYHLPVVEATIGDCAVKLGIDTGSSFNLLSDKLKKELRRHYAVRGIGFMRGIGPLTRIIMVGTIDEVSIAGIPFKDMKTVFSDALNMVPGVSVDGLLGYPFLSNMDKVAINFKKQKIYLWQAEKHR